MLEFRWVQIAPLSKLIYFYTAAKEISYSLNHEILLPGTLISNEWSIKFIQLNHCCTDTEALFLDLYLSIANGFVSSKIHDKRDDLDFDIVNFPFLDGDVPHRASYGVYMSQFVMFAIVCNHVADFNARNINV